MKLKQQEGITRRTFLAGSAALAASTGFVLAGCASTPASSAASASASDASVSSSSSSAANSTSAASRNANELRGAFAYSSTNYNPIGLNGGAALTMCATRHVFEGLYNLDMRTHEPYPALAADVPQRISATEYQIALREGATFSDGSPVAATDVVNAIEKNCANPTLGPLLDVIASASALDDKTVSITLNYPFPDLLPARLSLACVFPEAKELQLDRLPVGSGPWAYVPNELNGESVIMFKPNEYYNGSLPAKAESMVWSVMTSKSSMRATALYEHGAQAAEAIPDDSVTRLQDAGISVEYMQGFCQAFLMFNTLKKPFSDKRVRQALLYAIDVETLIQEKLGGHASPLTSFLPANHPSYHRASTVYSYNPEKAKALLEDAGQSSFEFTLLVNNNWVADLAESIAEYFRAVGITCTVNQRPIRWDELSDTDMVLPYDVVLASGDPSCFGYDADLLLSWWYGNNVWTQGRTCWARDPQGSFEEMQDLLLAARSHAGLERQEYWNQCFDIIADEVPLYGLFHREIATGWDSERINGFKPIDTSGLDFLGCELI